MWRKSLSLLVTCLLALFRLEICENLHAPDPLKQLFEGLNLSLNPCENFYDYVCHKRQSVPSVLWMSSTEIGDLIRNSQDGDTKEPLHKTWSRYFRDGCKDFNMLNESETIKVTYQTVSSVLGPIPTMKENDAFDRSIEQINRSRSETWRIMGKMARHFRSGVLTWLPLPLGAIKFKFLLSSMIDPLCRDMLELAERLYSFYGFSASSLGYEKARALGYNATHLCVSLYKSRMEHDPQNDPLVTRLRRFGTSDQLIDLEQVADLLQYVDWKPFVNEFVPGEVVGTQKLRFIGEIEEVAFLEQVGKILERYSLDTIKTWSILVVLLERLPTKDCDGLLMTLYTPFIINLYLSKHKVDATKLVNEILQMWRAIATAFDLLLTTVTWMDAHDKWNVRQKLNRIGFNPGLPRWIMNETELTRRCYPYDLQSSFDHNWMRAVTFYNDFALKTVAGEASTAEYPEHMPLFHRYPNLEENAFFMSGFGDATIALTFGLILPFANIHITELQFGQLGSIIGHELMHAFDSKSIHQMSTPLKNVSMGQYTSQQQCLIKHYSHYCHPSGEMCLEGERSLGENIADIIGLRVTFMAHKLLQQLRGHDSSWEYDGRMYSSDQLFFMSFAHGRCANIPWYTFGRNYAPMPVRVDGVLKHEKAFAKAFHCPGGAGLSPIESCMLWGDIANLL